MKETILYLLRHAFDMMPESQMKMAIEIGLEQERYDELIEFLREQAVDNQVDTVRIIGSVCTNLILRYHPTIVTN